MPNDIGLRPYICASFKYLETVPEDQSKKNRHWKKDLAFLKQWLIYTSFSRLDRNVELMTGKHVGQPPFLSDPEEGRVVAKREKAELPRCTIVEAAVHNVDEVIAGKSAPVFSRRIDPAIKPTHSSAHRIIQVADMAAYFVGKHLVNYSTVVPLLWKKEVISESAYKAIENANFALHMWDAMNIEVTLPMDRDEYANQPDWMKPITLPYEEHFQWADFVNCSVREAISLPDMSPRHCGVGYVVLF